MKGDPAHLRGATAWWRRAWLPAFALVAALTISLISISPSAIGSTGAKRLWLKRYNGPGSSTDGAEAVALSPDGSFVFVTGRAYLSGGNLAYVTIAHSATDGSRLWVSRYAPQAGGSGSEASAIVVSPGGSQVFVTGASNSDYATVAYASDTGARQWVGRYNGPADAIDYSTAIATSPDGTRVFVTGSTKISQQQTGYATIAFDSSTGNRLWVRRYNPGLSSDNSAWGIAVSPNGATVFVTGISQLESEASDYTTIAYDAATGAKQWLRRYDDNLHGRDEAAALSLSPDGSQVFVTGTSYGGPLASDDYATVAYDSETGGAQWVARYDGPNGLADQGRAIAVSPDGSHVFVTGDSGVSGSDIDIATVAYGALDGSQQWVRRYDGPGHWFDVASGLVTSPDGKVYVAGASGGMSGNYDYATEALDGATGGRLWVRRYAGRADGFDVPSGLAVGSDGARLFVTGRSYGGTAKDDDYATVAYEL
jgi:hypothetical protein